MGTSVEIQLQAASETSGRFDRSRFGACRYDAAVADNGAGIFGIDRYGSARFGGAPAARRDWVEIANAATTITISRGIKPDGAWYAADVGTATVTISNSLDPDTVPDLRPGTPLRVSYDGRRLFTGTVARCNVTWHKQRETDHWAYTVTVTAWDAVAQLARQVAPNRSGGERWTARIGGILNGVMAWAKTGQAGPLTDVRCAGTASNRSIPEALDLTATSARAGWWISAAGALMVSELTPSAQPAITYSDLTEPSFVAATGGIDWTKLATVTTLNNVAAAANQETTTATDTTNATAAAVYGNINATVTTNAYQSDLPAVIAAYTPHAPLTVLDITRIEHPGLPAESLDIYSPVNVQAFGKTVTSWLTGITIEITPISQKTTITLNRR